MIHTISVTAEHIRRGSPNSCRFCPIALALREQGFPMAEVGEDDALLSWTSRGSGVGTEGHLTIHLPPEAIRFVRNFDSEDCDLSTVHPFTFQIETP